MDKQNLQNALFRLALAEIATTGQDTAPYETALRTALRDTAAPRLDCDRDSLCLLAKTLRELRLAGQNAMDMACMVSLLRAKKEIGWNPMRLPTLRSLVEKPDGSETYMLLRNAVGVLALAWQILYRSQCVILNDKELIERCRL